MVDAPAVELTFQEVTFVYVGLGSLAACAALSSLIPLAQVYVAVSRHKEVFEVQVEL